MTDEQFKTLSNNDQQSIDIAVLKVQTEVIGKKVDELKELIRQEISMSRASFQGKLNMIDARITKNDCDINGEKGVKTQLNEIKTRLEVSTMKLASIISGATFLIYFAVNAIWDFITKKP